MKLHELKQSLESDATLRAQAQEQTIRDLIAQNKALKESLHKIQNRCYALSRGMLCVWCDIKGDCKAPQRMRPR